MHYLRHALATALPLAVALLLLKSRYFGVYDLLPLWGGVHVFIGGGDPYDFEALKQQLSVVFPGLPDTQHFVSPPWTLTFLRTILAGSFATSRLLILLLTVFAFYISIIRLQKLWGTLPRPCTLLVWGYVPLWACLYFGQISAFLLLGTVLALEWVHNPKSPWWKWALAITLLGLKPQGFVLTFPFLFGEFLYRSSRRERWYVVTYAAIAVALMSPSLNYASSWIATASFSYEQDSATLSRYVRTFSASFGTDSPLTLWILPVVAFVALAQRGLRIRDPFFFIFVILLSHLTAPYIWVYDSLALMPIFYAALGILTRDRIASPRRQVALVLTSLLVFPAYMALVSDFASMVLHNVVLASVFAVLAPDLRRYTA